MNDSRISDERHIDEILSAIRAEVGEARRSAASEAAEARSSTRIRMIDETLGEAETPDEIATIDGFERLDDESFLQAAYRFVLGREPDASGTTHYLPALRDGRATPTGILGALRYSAEGNARGVEIPGLQRAYFLDRLTRVPVLNRITGPMIRLLHQGRIQRRLLRRISAADLRHREMIRSVNGSFASIRRSLSVLEKEAAEAYRLAREASDSREAARTELAAARHQIVLQSRELMAFLEKARDRLPESAVSGHEHLDALGDHALDAFYVAFENRFRGSTEAITQRLMRYLDMFRNNPAVAAGGTVLDIGCGRGEWLSLLRSANIVGRGIDVNEAMVAQSRSGGLDVMEGNGVAILRELPQGSLAAVTGFHVVEHLSFSQLVSLFDGAYGALMEGGIILFETPNPENLVVGGCTFNYDPTHNKPLPPDLLRFIAEARGFTDVRIIRTDSDCDLDQPESGFEPKEVNDWFRQPGDYAVYGRKPALVPEDAGR